MPNNKYTISVNRERELQHKLEKQGYYAVRSSGSHGVADVIGIRPTPKKCSDPNHYEVKFIQVKTSQNFLKKSIEMKAEELPFGYANIEYHYFPVRNEKNREKREKEEEKKKKIKKAKK